MGDWVRFWLTYAICHFFITRLGEQRKGGEQENRRGGDRHRDSPWRAEEEISRETDSKDTATGVCVCVCVSLCVCVCV